MNVLNKVGVLCADGTLLEVSDCNSQVEGSEFDGPVLWDTVDEAEDSMSECGDLPDGCAYCKVILTIVPPSV